MPNCFRSVREINKVECAAEATLTIRPEVGKTRKPVVIPLHENLVKLLTERLVNLKSNALVFKPVPNIKTFKRDLAAAGIAFKDENDHQFDFHALRTTFSTRLLREGILLSIARRLTRHNSVATLEKHYDKLGLSDAVEALKKMPRYGKRA